ncbi:hypothetical protein AB6A40_006790 [Gnathostoma spinigerum]|uniref:Uncharacterized protein n=1 Tax=Gnathostoma spinigerum TaxID=75299 RepID=A0ABD6ERK2_9BILA
MDSIFKTISLNKLRRELHCCSKHPFQVKVLLDSSAIRPKDLVLNITDRRNKSFMTNKTTSEYLEMDTDDIAQQTATHEDTARAEDLFDQTLHKGRDITIRNLEQMRTAYNTWREQNAFELLQNEELRARFWFRLLQVKKLNEHLLQARDVLDELIAEAVNETMDKTQVATDTVEDFRTDNTNDA